MKRTVAIISIGGYEEKIEVDKVHLGYNGFLSILGKDGVTYETHSANVVMISRESEVDTE